MHVHYSFFSLYIGFPIGFLLTKVFNQCYFVIYQIVFLLLEFYPIDFFPSNSHVQLLYSGGYQKRSIVNLFVYPPLHYWYISSEFHKLCVLSSKF